MPNVRLNFKANTTIGGLLVTVKRFSDYIKSIEKFRDERDTEFWYRGHSSTSYKLEPFTHRNRTPEDKPKIGIAEQETYDEFVRRSPLFDGQRRDQWDLLFLMQHYRAPTRLLDWTASPLVALYFALMTPDKKDPAVVWCFDPAAWNGIVLSDIKEPPRIFTTDDSLVKQYHPAHKDKTSRNEPLAIQGIMNNPRINAQKGRFVIFSSEPKPLEVFATDYKVKENGKILGKIEVLPEHKERLLKDLERYGITYSTIFPDLEGLALEIRRRFGANHV
ncbi:hypothetical protein ASF70_14680 [Rhizobium sp. Leaf321]|nr:hypothetical protein ASF70_14680 [Rhizobium sp. Leaf321]